MIKAVLCLQFPLSEGFQHSEISPCSESQQSSFSLRFFQELKWSNDKRLGSIKQLNFSQIYIFFLQNNDCVKLISKLFWNQFKILQYNITGLVVFFLVEIVTTSFSCTQSFYFDYSILWWGRRWRSGRFLSWLQLCLGKAETHGSLQKSSSWEMCLIWIYSLWNFIKRPDGITFF